MTHYQIIVITDCQCKFNTLMALQSVSTNRGITWLSQAFLSDTSTSSHISVSGEISKPVIIYTLLTLGEKL